VLQVCELEEFVTSVSSVQGLQHWRLTAGTHRHWTTQQTGSKTAQTGSTSQTSSTPLQAGSPPLETGLTSPTGFTSLSQTGWSDLLLENQPGLKYAITGDQSVIITPCLPPPKPRAVRDWNKGRMLYKQVKQKQDILENAAQKAENKPTIEKEVVTKKKKGGYRLNLFTGKREWMSQEESDSQPSSQELQTDRKTDTESQGTTHVSKKHKPDVNKTTPLKGIVQGNLSLTTLEHSQGTQEPSQTEDESILHSTPLLRRQSTDLFEPECTPIAAGTQPTPGNKSQGSQGSQGGQGNEEFVTPHRARPLRRLSTNTAATLRRAILNTQMKVSHY